MFFVSKKREISILVQEEILYDFELLLECEKTVFLRDALVVIMKQQRKYYNKLIILH